MTQLGITGATGRVGGRVSRGLAAAGFPQTLIVRDPARAPSLPGADVRRALYGDPISARAALRDVATLFMVSGAEAPDRVQDHITFVDSAVTAGVEHIVYLSLLGAAASATFTLARDHWTTEQHIRGTGVGFTFLRDSLYADFLAFLVSDDDVIRGPAGDGRFAPVAIDDVADSAFAVLRAPADHLGATYRLTGPHVTTMSEAAGLLAAATGRPVRFENESVAQAYASRAHFRAPDWQVDAWVTTYTAIAGGEFDVVTDDVTRLTGHPATSLREVLARSGR